MNSNKRLIMKNLAKLYDLCALIAAFLFATFVLQVSPAGMTLSQFMAVRIQLGNFLLFALLLVAWHNLFTLCGLYVSKRLTNRFAEIYEVSRATVLASAFLAIAGKALHLRIISIPFVLIAWIVCTWAMVSGRLAARSLLLVLRCRGHNSRFLLVVGTNERAIGFAEWIKARPELGYQIVGFADDEWAGRPGFDATGNKLVCSLEGVAEFLRHNVVDEAAIYLPLRSYYEFTAQLIAIFEQHGIVARVDSQIFKSRSQGTATPEHDENSQIAAAEHSVELWPAVIKRAIDCVASLVLLILLMPLLLVVGVLVKLSSEGPVLFRQTRVGLNKRMFSIYKFRTMFADAEKAQGQLLSRNEMSGPVFKIKDDPRITPLGRILRKTSIDELPQLFNVLKGQMSLVGPRAMSLRDYRLFDKDCHRRRFSVKPGITCLWQVHGRNSIPFEQWMELDLQYIDRWSLWLDIKILAKTVPAVLRGTGAA
jgi:exopolysaccharide biosynthesis polyprenyl glycosylphosphotransferase